MRLRDNNDSEALRSGYRIVSHELTASSKGGFTMNANSTLAATACWTAAVRARESRREDRLFHDPWAEALAGEQGASWIVQRPEDSTITMALRTRYFDDFLEKISSLDEIRQVVLLAAGFDTRAFRLKWPAGVCIFEMDQPSVMDYKVLPPSSVATPP